MMKRKSRLEKMSLKSWRNFNRNSKVIRYHDTDKWRWKLTDAEKIQYNIIQKKFEEYLEKGK